MCYSDLQKALSRLRIPFAEGEWRDAEEMQSDYGVYALDGDASLMADDGHAERAAMGTVDLYIWGEPGFAQAADVEEAMTAAGVTWRVVSAAAYEPDSGFTHWRWRVICFWG
jgi:hypothetical protein